MRFHFVTTRRGSPFMTELLAAVAEAVADVGIEVEMAYDAFPPGASDSVYVCIPHELQAWGARERWPDAAQRERTIAFCTENPGTTWFEATYDLVGEFAAAVSINRSSAAELRGRGVRCEHLQLGYSPRWDRWRRRADSSRPMDVLYLGASDTRRDPLLGAIGRDLWRWRCRFLVPPLEPRSAPRADFLLGEEKYESLCSAKLLLNLHRTTSRAFEWMRLLEAISNGCVVVSEESLDSEPLLAGEHFLTADAAGMGAAVDALLREPGRLAAIREQAYDFIRQALPMAPAGAHLAELAAELPRCPPGPPKWGQAAETRPGAPPPPGVATAPDESRNATTGRQRPNVRPTRLAGVARRLECALRRSTGVLAESAGYRHARPLVSVLVVLEERASEQNVDGTLRSIAWTSEPEVELLAVSHAARSDAARAARRFVARNDELASQLLTSDDDSSAGARNTLLSAARGQYVLALDPGASVFPSTLTRLAEALATDPGAAFAYPMVAVLDGSHPVALGGALPWEPNRLLRESYIDASVLVHRERLLRLGGYRSDPSLGRWEGVELWCRLAAAGERGVHLPQVLASRTASSLSGHAGPLPPDVEGRLRSLFPGLAQEEPMAEPASVAL